MLASLLLNRITLQPGQALYLPGGNLHAYLAGVGIEIMANSDNVLRGGLTPKHVDVAELMKVLDFRPGDVPILHGDPGIAGRVGVPHPDPGVPAVPARAVSGPAGDHPRRSAGAAGGRRCEWRCPTVGVAR